MKPQLYKIKPFDGVNPHQISFAWQGNQTFGSRCIIKNNRTNELIYDSISTTNDLIHTIPANTLSNGALYNIRIASIDINNNLSDYSSVELFYCFTTPVLSFSNIENNDTIRNSNYQVNLTYNQLENEPLQSYQLILYDSSNEQIFTSGVLYDTNNMQTTLYNLEDSKTYKIKAFGITVNGFEFETEYINFNVDYIRPSMYALLTTENLKEEGYIQLTSNIKAVECKVTNSPPTYINDEYIDLRNNNLYIDGDFSLNKDFTLNIKGYNFAEGLIFKGINEISSVELYKSKKTIITGYTTENYPVYPYTYKDENNNECIYYKKNPIYTQKHYFYLLIKGSNIPTYIESNTIDSLMDGELLSIWITKSNNLFSIEIKKV